MPNNLTLKRGNKHSRPASHWSIWPSPRLIERCKPRHSIPLRFIFLPYHLLANRLVALNTSTRLHILLQDYLLALACTMNYMVRIIVTSPQACTTARFRTPTKVYSIALGMQVTMISRTETHPQWLVTKATENQEELLTWTRNSRTTSAMALSEKVKDTRLTMPAYQLWRKIVEMTIREQNHQLAIILTYYGSPKTSNILLSYTASWGSIACLCFQQALQMLKVSREIDEETSFSDIKSDFHLYFFIIVTFLSLQCTAPRKGRKKVSCV